MSSIYDFNAYYLKEKNMPPELRTPKRLAWLDVLVRVIQKKHEEAFANSNSFKTGFSLLFWDFFTSYNIGDQVRVGIARYENLKPGSGVFPVGNTDDWLLLDTDFIGTDIRSKIYAGKMSLEYILNLYFNNTFQNLPPIYIQTQGSAYPTMMMNNNSQPFLNYMPSNSLLQQFYMPSVSTYSNGAVNFIVYVPNAIFQNLGATLADQKNTVRNIVDRYNTAGITYDVLPY